jgi:hypothetical protein
MDVSAIEFNKNITWIGTNVSIKVINKILNNFNFIKIKLFLKLNFRRPLY